ncbi:MAG: histidinol-phosphate transaminase [Sandaracinaceae bacterium]|nr:histidinol-phosphate transaminase [Sandaracinaceae bacterium]
MSLLDLVRPSLRDVAAYAVPSDRAMVKLDANESACPLSEEARRKLGDALAAVDGRRYPDPRAEKVRALVAKQLGARPEELVLGSGSDEIIALLSTALSAPRAGSTTSCILVPTPTFVMYKVTATAHGMRTVEVPLTRDFELDVPAMQTSITAERPHIVYFATPNNPTGNAYDQASMQTLIRANVDTLFVIDEAYAAYQGFSLASWFDDFPNLAIMGTLSKVGFAAARVGWIRLPLSLAQEVDKARQPFNLNAYAQVVAELALTEFAPEIGQHIKVLTQERERLMTGLLSLPNISPYQSAANFIFAETVHDADRVQHSLKGHGILIRSFHKHGGVLSNKVRITVGTPSENERLLQALPIALR